MAPDRGLTKTRTMESDEPSSSYDRGELVDYNGRIDEHEDPQEPRGRSETRRFLAEQADQGRSFTLRGTLVGLVIGVVICFSNMYFGLQTGWIGGMAMPSALISFAFFKSVTSYIKYPFTPVENVLVTTVAGAVGTMPLGCGFVGVMPALNYLLNSEENGPLVLGIGKLIIWAVGLCFFGVVIAVPLRKQVIIREKLKFPSGTATALIIGVLHGNNEEGGEVKNEDSLNLFRRRSQDMFRSPSKSIRPPGARNEGLTPLMSHGTVDNDERLPEKDHRNDWKSRIKSLLLSFTISATYTLIQYFIPQLRSLPVFGLPLASNWLWTLNPSPAYVGQGIIMGPATTFHMLLGALVGWGILSPLAKKKGWAPGPVDSWESGSKGWIVWVSLAIMLADSVISLSWLLLHPVIVHGLKTFSHIQKHVRRRGLFSMINTSESRTGDYKALNSSESSDPMTTGIRDSFEASSHSRSTDTDLSEPDAPSSHLVSNRTVAVLAILSILVCILSVRIVFGALIPYYAIFLAIFMALILSIMGVRALGETDINPVSGISKLSQLVFALVIPASNPNAITINLLAGAITEAGALQAGDMMQDLKCGHLLGAAPNAQFYGQMIGSFVGAIVSAAVYQLYTSVYKIPGGMFQVPTAFVWIFTARLVTGKGLPPMAWQWALGACILFSGTTVLRAAGHGKWWQAWVPGGIAVAVGIYNVPSFTLARAIGGVVSWYWRIYRRQEETPVIVLASGLILGEGVVSILNLVLTSLNVPHL